VDLSVELTDLHLSRLTNRRGYSGAPALSPDGRAVVYASDTTGALELYLVGLVPGSAELALTKDRGQNTQPAWSPDGQWIAFHSRKRGGVWIVPASGGICQQADLIDPAWSPMAHDRVHVGRRRSGGAVVARTIARDGTARRELTRGKPPADIARPTGPTTESTSSSS
jgi:dipeptidyl aminopeptidase/acylaminoacyl peptidase